jgi:hypothetical protein
LDIFLLFLVIFLFQLEKVSIRLSKRHISMTPSYYGSKQSDVCRLIVSWMQAGRFSRGGGERERVVSHNSRHSQLSTRSTEVARTTRGRKIDIPCGLVCGGVCVFLRSLAADTIRKRAQVLKKKKEIFLTLGTPNERPYFWSGSCWPSQRTQIIVVIITNKDRRPVEK